MSLQRNKMENYDAFREPQQMDADKGCLGTEKMCLNRGRKDGSLGPRPARTLT